MNKIFSLVVLSFCLISISSAQDGLKTLKNAEKALKKFASNPADKADELTKGMELMSSAFASEDVKNSAKAWITKAKALKSIADAEIKASTLDASGGYEFAVPSAAVDAFDAYEMAGKLTDKKNEKKEVQVGLTNIENHLNNYAIIAYQEKKYDTAFDNFSRSIKAQTLLTEMGKESRLDDQKLKDDQYFFTAVSGFYAKKFDESLPYLDYLEKNESKEPFVYEALYNIYEPKDDEKALSYLTKGREMAPDDTGLLFTEINYFLKREKLDQLISKLEVALEKEPDNVSIYNTIGSVYDQLQQKEEDPAKSKEYFDKALNYYGEGLTKDATNFDATYSMGALYYNKAAKYVDQLNELAADLSPAGMKKYDALKAEMNGLFEQALPHFIKAEGLNANDGNTIIALKEIYARLNNLEKSNEYKTKMENLGN